MTAEGGFDLRHMDGFPVVIVTGDVDMTNSHELEAFLDRAVQADRGAVVVSLERTTYFDSKGVRVLLRAAERLRTTRQRLVVVAPTASVSRRILEIAGAAAILPLFGTVEEALASLS